MASTVLDLIPGLPEELARECLLRIDYTAFPTVKSVCRLWRDEVQSPAFHRLRKSTRLPRTLVAMVQAQHLPLDSSHSSPKSLAAAPSPFYRLVLLDTATFQWSTLPTIPSLPHGLPFFCQVAASFVPGPSILVLGGWDPVTWAASDAVWAYDLVSGRWRRAAPIPGPPRSFFACASDAVRGLVYVAGGHDKEKNALRSAMRYDVAADHWDRIPDMAAERDECKAVFFSGKFHVLGGYDTDNQGHFCRSAETFHANSSSWGPVDEDALGAAGACPRTCLVVGDRMYRCRADRVEVRGAGERGTAAHGGWAPFADIPGDARVAPWVEAAGDSRLLVVGSACHGGDHESYLLDLASAQWVKIDVPEKYAGHVQAGCCIDI